MGLFRTAVIVGAVVALMPTDRNQQARLYDQAASAAKWTMTFCDRNADMCRQGGELWGVFVKKAQFAGQMALQLIQEQASRGGQVEPARAAYGDETRRADPVSMRPVPALERREPAPEWRQRGTLRDDDMQPHWRARERDSGRGY